MDLSRVSCSRNTNNYITASHLLLLTVLIINHPSVFSRVMLLYYPSEITELFHVDVYLRKYSYCCYLHYSVSMPHTSVFSRALELQAFSLKPLLRRAMAYESMERYRQAYVDYKTVLQIDSSIQAANDSVNR